MAVRRRKEVEDPNNTWNMQLMAAVLAKDTKKADELLLKGAQIDHYALADVSLLPAGAADVRGLLSTPHTTLQPNGAYYNPAVPSNTTGGTAVGGGTSGPASNAPVNAALSSTLAAAKPPASASATVGAAPTLDAAQLQQQQDAAAAQGPALADPNSRHVTAITPFIAAILNEDLATAAWVASTGGNPNAQLNNGRNGTVLHFLVRTDNGPLLAAVLSGRAAIDTALDIDAPEASTRLSPVALALALRKPEMARLLLRHGAANPFTNLVDGKYTSTQRACLTGDVATLETNLAAGDNIRQKCRVAGQTLFHLALLQPAVLDVLIERGSGAAYAGGGLFGGGGGADGNSPYPASAGGAGSPAVSPNGRAGGGGGGGLGSTQKGGGAQQSAALSGAAAALAEVTTPSGPFATPLTLNTAVNDDGETPLVFVIKYWGACTGTTGGGGTGVVPHGAASPSAAALAAAAANFGAAVTTTPAASAAAVTGSHPAVTATAALLAPNVVSGATVASAAPVGGLTSLPLSPLPTVPIVAAGTNGYNATIAAAITLATGAVPQPAAGGAAAHGSNAADGSEGGGKGGADASTSNNASGAALKRGGDRHGGNGPSAASFGAGLPRTALELLDFLVAKGADPSATPDASLFGMTPLMHAIQSYAPDLIRRLVMDYKVDLNARDKTGATALHYAVAARMKGALDMLCQAEGIDLNAADTAGEAPLHRAAARGEVWAINHLLAQPFTDVNAVDAKGRTALHSAVAADCAAAVEALLTRCAPDIGAPPPIEKGKKAPTVKKGQPPPEPPVPMRLDVERAEAATGWTALQLAFALKRHHLATLLVAGAGGGLGGGASVQRPFGPCGGWLLHEAVRQQSGAMVALLLGAGADVLARDANDQTALHAACAIPNADTAIVEMLLSAAAVASAPKQPSSTANAVAGATAPGSAGAAATTSPSATPTSTAIGGAIPLGTPPPQPHTIASGSAQPSAANSPATAAAITSSSPAASLQPSPTFTFAIGGSGSKKALPCVNDQDDLTLSAPLHLAAATEHSGLVALLLQNGASPSATNARLETALHVACDGADAAVADAVMDGGGAKKTNVYAVRGFGADGQVDHLRSAADAALLSARLRGRGGGAEGNDHSQHPPLTIEALRAPIPIARRDFTARTAIVHALIAAGAPLRTNDREGRLPLHRAAASGNAAAVRAILAAATTGREAMLLACDANGWTPLHSAVALGGGGAVDVIEALLPFYEALPPSCFGVRPREGPTVTPKTRIVGGSSAVAAAADHSSWGSNDHSLRSAGGAGTARSGALSPTAASAAQLTARVPPPTSSSVLSGQSVAADVAVAPQPIVLTTETDPVLAVLRRQDHNGRPPLLLAASMGAVEAGRLLVRYQKQRTDGLKKGAVVSKYTTNAATAAAVSAAPSFRQNAVMV